MKTIALKNITLSGFKSFSASSEIDLSDSVGLTFIAGDNQIEPRLGQNGSGKSTLLGDAPVFCLYGSGVQGTRINDLVARGQKQASVTCTFDVDGEAREIRRSGPPSRVHIDGELSEQADVDRLVGLTKRQYLNSVLYGQGMPLFIDLSIPERGELLDEVLGLEIWMKAAKEAADRHAAVTADLNRLRVEVGRTEGALSSLEDVDALTAISKEWRQEHRLRRQTVKQQLGALTKEIEAQQEQLTELESAEVPDHDAVYRRLEKQQLTESDLKSQLAVRRADLERIDGDLEFFRENAECPSCGQAIDEAVAQEHRVKHEDERASASADAEMLSEAIGTVAGRIAKLRDQWSGAKAKARACDNVIIQLRSGIDAKQREVRSLSLQLDRIADEENPYRARIDAVRQQRQDLQTKLERQKSRDAQFNSKLTALDFWKQGFRRARLFCINRVLKQLDIEAANSAGSLGLVGWKITHSTETETRAGTQKLGVQIQVQAPHMSGPFSAWSGGEGQRVRLATALGFGSLIQRWMGVRWQQEVFDEPTQFLSDAGIEDLLECLRIRADVMGKRVYICDHRGLQNNGFSQVLIVVKDEKGSRVLQ